MERIGLSLCLMIFCGTASAAQFSEEFMLQREAELTAERIHIKNMNLIGVNPKTCKPDDNVLLGQINQIRNGELNHCPDVIKDKIQVHDDLLTQLKSGTLTFPKVAALTTIPAISSPSTIQDNFVEEKAFDKNPPQTTSSENEDEWNEEDKILSNYESNKKEYRPGEDDGLFKILSKAYVRNLNKIWEKKKTDE